MPGQTVAELQTLNQIRGRLRIEDLRKVQDTMEARFADIVSKSDMQCLELCWNRNGEAPPPSRGEIDYQILENLLPRRCLQLLSIENYNGERLPGFVSSIRTSRGVVAAWSQKSQKNFPLSGIAHIPKIDDMVPGLSLHLHTDFSSLSLCLVESFEFPHVYYLLHVLNF